MGESLGEDNSASVPYYFFFLCPMLLFARTDSVDQKKFYLKAAQEKNFFSNIQQFKSIDVVPYMKDNSIILYGVIRNLEKNIVWGYDSDSIVKKLDMDDVIPFCDFMFVDSLSKDSSQMFFSFERDGWCQAAIVSNFSFDGGKKYLFYSVKVKSRDNRLLLDSVVYFNQFETDLLWINGCKNDKCSIFTSNVCWRMNADKDCFANNYNRWIYKDFQVRPRCSWIKFEPLPKAVMKNGVHPKSLGYLVASKEGTCVIQYKKGCIRREMEVVSVRRDGFYHIYMKSMFQKNKDYPQYPYFNLLFENIDRYLNQNHAR